MSTLYGPCEYFPNKIIMGLCLLMFIGHTARVLHMAMSPDGSTVVSAAADETLRLWKCFAVDPTKKKASTSSSMLSTAPKTMMRGGIR